MNKTLKIITALPAIIFLLMGINWLARPTDAADALGMPLLDGIGRSTQIGDMSAFFLGLSAMIFIGLITRKRAWLSAPALLLGLTATCRVLAWLLHDAALPMDLIAPEVVFCALLLFSASRLEKNL